ncbi:hypothetical protein BDZ45DRAFT_93322 [Acephala macrosclerotiorum]|nr:hypothetical protein BDZ45DRAFT_93322 [Acephala macrosclerotiorum]
MPKSFQNYLVIAERSCAGNLSHCISQITSEACKARCDLCLNWQTCAWPAMLIIGKPRCQLSSSQPTRYFVGNAEIMVKYQAPAICLLVCQTPPQQQHTHLIAQKKSSPSKKHFNLDYLIVFTFADHHMLACPMSSADQGAIPYKLPWAIPLISQETTSISLYPALRSCSILGHSTTFNLSILNSYLSDA